MLLSPQPKVVEVIYEIALITFFVTFHIDTRIITLFLLLFYLNDKKSGSDLKTKAWDVWNDSNNDYALLLNIAYKNWFTAALNKRVFKNHFIYFYHMYSF